MNPYKTRLRKEIRERKRSMTPDDICFRSEKLCRMVLESQQYRQAHTIYGYLPFNQEVRLQPLLQQALLDGKQIALPKCTGQKMHFVRITGFSHIQTSPLGAPEPVDTEPIAQDPSALVLVPGLAFDAVGHRLGYGGGFYDRFLAQEPLHPTLALCYDFQFFPLLEAEPHDIIIDTVFWT